MAENVMGVMVRVPGYRRKHRTARLIRRRESHVLRDLLTFAAGVGVGVGIGILCAPAGGEETRDALADRLQEVGAGVRKHFSGEPETRKPVSDVA